MGPIADRIVVAVVLSGLAAWAFWGWRSWLTKRPGQLGFGAASSLVGFSFATLSALLEITTGLYTQFTDGFRFMDPVLLRIYGVGLITALLGFICALPGMWTKTPLRGKAPAFSAILLLLWLGQAMGE